MKRSFPLTAAVAILSPVALLFSVVCVLAGRGPSDDRIALAFGKQGIRISLSEAAAIRDDVQIALREAKAHGLGNSKVDFAAVEIAQELGLDTGRGSNSVKNVVAAIGWLLRNGDVAPPPPPPPPPPIAWEEYFRDSTNLWNQPDFLKLVGSRGFSPVKISWEDIGRYEGSVWGDRISDVGIWVRQDEVDPGSARLALSVRRDDNFRDKVLMVPADKIKIHQRRGGKTIEKTLPERLRELGLASRKRDRNVIVSNQFAIVPVPDRSMRGAWPEGVPPRAAFNFSIFPYGSTNFVITDVIEGSSEAIVGPGTHQLLYANVDGEKAPFTASRAEDRPDLLRLEKKLRAQGMDVDVQRYYLIQVPLRRDARVALSNMGTPPLDRGFGDAVVLGGVEGGVAGGVTGAVPAPPTAQVTAETDMANESQAKATKDLAASKRQKREGLTRVAIGHGETEGPYDAGSGWRGARAEEPIRVTVVYFVTPVGKVTKKDMETFSKAFEAWDREAIWGGSFVVKETN